MMFHPQPFLLAFSNQLAHTHIDPSFVFLGKNEDFSFNSSLVGSINSGHHQENVFDRKILDLSLNVKKNSDKTNEIMTLLDKLQKNFQTIEEDFSSIDFGLSTIEKDSSPQTCFQESCSLERNMISEVKNNRTHPKIKLMEKIFGRKQYSYKLAFNGKFPKILFKQRNISLKILLKNMLGENVINGNQISLNLKVFKNNGEQIFSDNPDHSFMQGLCQTQIQNGVGNFSKIHPQQVSRGFSGKGICIIVYATSQQNQAQSQGLQIQASQIQPLIFYNVKVVVKQNKLIRKNQKSNSFEEDLQN